MAEVAGRKCTRTEDAREEASEGGEEDFPTKHINKKVGKVGGVIYTCRGCVIYTIYEKGAEGKARGQQRLRRGRGQEDGDGGGGGGASEFFEL